jgi:hypothetical protein
MGIIGINPVAKKPQRSTLETIALGLDIAAKTLGMAMLIPENMRRNKELGYSIDSAAANTKRTMRETGYEEMPQANMYPPFHQNPDYTSPGRGVGYKYVGIPQTGSEQDTLRKLRTPTQVEIDSFQKRLGKRLGKPVDYTPTTIGEMESFESNITGDVYKREADKKEKDDFVKFSNENINKINKDLEDRKDYYTTIVQESKNKDFASPQERNVSDMIVLTNFGRFFVPNARMGSQADMEEVQAASGMHNFIENFTSVANGKGLEPAVRDAMIKRVMSQWTSKVENAKIMRDAETTAAINRGVDPALLNSIDWGRLTYHDIPRATTARRPTIQDGWVYEWNPQLQIYGPNPSRKATPEEIRRGREGK